MDRTAALRVQLERQVAHWDAAAQALTDPSSFASEAAWRALEGYLDCAVRASLDASTKRLRTEVVGVRRQLDHARSLPELLDVARRLREVRRRYAQVETVVEFYTDAVSTRTSPTLGGHLRALDRLAEQSMAAVLGPLGRPVPPVLTYVDKGLGAAILRAGVRLWDGGSSPAAAIKMTRHNLYRPTSLLHETGHQVAHVLGWNTEAAATIARLLHADPALAALWASWISEITADVHAFVHTGYASVAALHDVVANEPEFVLHLGVGDPHPVAWVRVLLGVELCRQSYGRGPWDELADAWVTTHPLRRARPGVARLLQRSLPYLPALAAVLLTEPLRAFGARPVTAIVDPGRVSPAALTRLAADAGASLFTSPHWATREGLRIVALTGLRIAVEPRAAATHVGDFRRFTQTLSSLTPATRAA